MAEEWTCAGCGKVSPDRLRACECATSVVVRKGGKSAWKRGEGDEYDRVSELEVALAWYGEQARLCRLIHSEGDAGRQALAADGGKRASAALTKFSEG